MAKRSVSVGLSLEAGQYKTEATVVEAKTRGVDDAVTDLDRDITKIPPDAAKAAAAMKLLGGDADGVKAKLHDLGPEASNSLQLVDKQLDETRTKMRQAAADFNQTGSAESFKLWQNLSDDHGELSKLKKNLSDALTPDVGKTAFWDKTKGWIGMVGDEAGKVFDQSFQSGAQGAGKGFAKTLAENFSSDFANFTSPQGAITMAIYVGIGAALTTALAPMASGALVGGTGLGLLAAGIAGTFQDPRIKAGAGAMMGDLKVAFTEGTSGLVAPVQAAMGNLDHFIQGLNLKSLFAPLGQFIGPVETSLEGFLTKVLKGFRDLVGNLGPVMNVFEARLPAIGQAIGDLFTRMSRNAGDNASALDALMTIIVNVINITGAMIEAFDHWWRGLLTAADVVEHIFKAAFDWIPGIGSMIDGATASLDRMVAEANGGTGSINKLGGSVGGLGDVTSSAADRWANLTTRMQDAAAQANALKTGMDNLFGITMGVDQATLQYNIGVTNLKSSLDLAGHSLNEQSAAGQKNVGAVQQQIQNIEQLRDANIANGSGIDWSNAQYAKQLDALKSTLIQMGFNKDQVSAMINKYKQIPANVSTVMNVLGIDAATSKVTSLTQKFNALSGKVVTTTIVTDTVTGETSKHVTSKGLNRWGGIYQHAADGLLSQASTYSATDPGRYMIAEPQTGGEAFVPRYGNYMRSTDILDKASRWYDGRFVPNGASASAPAVTVSPKFQVVISAKAGAEQAILSMVDVRIEQATTATASAVSGGVRL